MSVTATAVKLQINVPKLFFGRSNNKCFNLLLSPIALTFHALYAYVFSCIFIYIARLFNHLCCFPCVHYKFLPKLYKFTDKNFPPTKEIIGAEAEIQSDKAENATLENLEFKRASDVIVNPVLFQDGVEPNDVVQGNLANCWLMSAVVCLAEFPGLVDSVFLTREISYRGKYQLTLFDGYNHRWKIITVDDFLPTRDTPGNSFQVNKFLYAQPKNDAKEVWVCILEKAFAKFRGSYGALRGGNALWAFRCLTGDFVFRLAKEKSEGDAKGNPVWKRYELVDQDPKDTSPFAVTETSDVFQERDLFDLLRAYDNSKALMAASVKKDDEAKNSNVEEVDEETGLVKGHSYALLSVKRVGKGVLGDLSDNEEFCMVKLRNPWGEFEWNGDWSDKSELWEKHPSVKRACKFEKAEDGTFWMNFSDFQKHFDNIDVCDRTVGFKDFSLNVHEVSKDLDTCKGQTKKQLGPIRGCTEGLLRFVCLCQGIRNLYFGNESSQKVKPESEWDKGGRDDGILNVV